MTVAKRIDAEMRKLPSTRSNAEFLRHYLGTELDLLGLKLPVQRERLRQGYLGLTDLPPEKQAPLWLKVWTTAKFFESMSQALFFFESWAEDRKRKVRKGLLLKGSVFDPLWPYLIEMVDRIDNWAHSDGISNLISAAVEERPSRRLATLRMWNRDSRPWLRRQSIVCLHYYARMRRRPLPVSTTLPLIKRLLKDEHFYVQRGVGWALRESGNVDPAAVLRFLNNHVAKLSAVAFSAATEKLHPREKARLKKQRRDSRLAARHARAVILALSSLTASLLTLGLPALASPALEADAGGNSTWRTLYREQVAPGFNRLTSRDSYSILGYGTAAVFLARSQDEELRDAWRGNQRMSPDLSDAGNKFGLYAASAVIAGGQYLFDRPNSFHHLRSLVAVTIVGNVLKYSAQRERPNQLDSLSFPSGHTYTAFATAASLHFTYGWRIGVVAYPIAALVGMSRVADDYHWFSDVTAGAVLGIWIASLSYYATSPASERSEANRPQVFPFIANNSAGLVWNAELP